MAWPGWREDGVCLNHCSASSSRSPGLSESPTHILKMRLFYLLSRVVVGIHSVDLWIAEYKEVRTVWWGWGHCYASEDLVFSRQGEWKGSRLFQNVKYPLSLCCVMNLIDYYKPQTSNYPSTAEQGRPHFITIKLNSLKILFIFTFSQPMTAKGFFCVVVVCLFASLSLPQMLVLAVIISPQCLVLFGLSI